MSLGIQKKTLFDIFRDTYNLNGPSNPDGSYDDSLVMKLNPFYYTCLIPLDDITEDNGRTEFIVGSHCLTYNEAKGGFPIEIETKLACLFIFMLSYMYVISLLIWLSISIGNPPKRK